MIDRDLLRKLGWSDGLIDSISQVAEPLRRSVHVGPITTPVVQVQPISSTAIYSDAVTDNTFRAFTVCDGAAADELAAKNKAERQSG